MNKNNNGLLGLLQIFAIAGQELDTDDFDKTLKDASLKIRRSQLLAMFEAIEKMQPTKDRVMMCVKIIKKYYKYITDDTFVNPLRCIFASTSNGPIFALVEFGHLIDPKIFEKIFKKYSGTGPIVLYPSTKEYDFLECRTCDVLGKLYKQNPEFAMPLLSVFTEYLASCSYLAGEFIYEIVKASNMSKAAFIKKVLSSSKYDDCFDGLLPYIKNFLRFKYYQTLNILWSVPISLDNSEMKIKSLAQLIFTNTITMSGYTFRKKLIFEKMNKKTKHALTLELNTLFSQEEKI